MDDGKLELVVMGVVIGVLLYGAYISCVVGYGGCVRKQPQQSERAHTTKAPNLEDEIKDDALQYYIHNNAMNLLNGE